MQCEFDGIYFTTKPNNFLPKFNITEERHKLLKRKQTAAESIDTYVTDLKYIAQHCNFGPLTDDIVKDIFSWNLHNINIKERIISDQPTTLDEAVAIARGMEATNGQDETLDSNTEQVINYVKSSNHRQLPHHSSQSHSTPRDINLFSKSCSLEKGNSSEAPDKPSKSVENSNSKKQNKKTHIKQPLNAFMLYMKEMRPKITGRAAIINRILGTQWHALSREERAKYIEKAERERQLHMQLYSSQSEKKSTTKYRSAKRRVPGERFKKCRARYGFDKRDRWCERCKRKKKCMYYKEALAAASKAAVVPETSPKAPCSEDLKVKSGELLDASNNDVALGEHSKKCGARYGVSQQDRWCESCRRKGKCIYYEKARATPSKVDVIPKTSPEVPCFEDDIKVEWEELSDSSNDDDACYV